LKNIYAKKNIVYIKSTASSFENPEEIVENLRIKFSKENCRNVILDLTEQSFLNCIRIGVLVATYHFSEFLNGKIYIIVQDMQAKKYIETLNFSGAIVIYADTPERNKNLVATNNIA